ncbi:MAG: DUF1015 family protein [Clostridiales bacterium]|nr:DUF1015 family protein [Clostridiales bacterium]
MAIVRPFKGIRPKAELASKVAELPYDVMNREEAKQMGKDNPYSFLHISRSEIDLDDSVGSYDEKVYSKAKENLDKMISDGILAHDKESVYYIYQQKMENRVQTGIVACTSIDEYLSDVIKKHEFTRPVKETDRINHFDKCDANTEPVFLTYRSNDEINNIIVEWVKNHKPEYDFVSEDGITHTLWVLNDKELSNKIQSIFAGIDYLYIADGHHRTASAVKVGLKRRQENPNFTGEEEYNYFLSVIFPDKDMYIMDYNRVVKDLNGLIKEELIKKIEEKFDVEKAEKNVQVKPSKKHAFGMFVENQWYKLVAKEGTFDKNDPVERIDAEILQSNLLNPILGIGNPRTDKRIDFVGGIRGLKELEKRVSKDMKIAFSMYPTSIEDLFSIADAGEVMPPKSTWFEPKLRSGLFVHALS